MDEEQLKKHIKGVKEDDPDLYEELENEEIKELIHTEEVSKETTTKKGVNKKLISVLIAVFMVAGAVGSLGAVLNIPAIQFLQKSHQLSQLDYIQDYKEAVVTVKSEDRKGTGFNVSSEGFIITNHHIIENNDEALISFSDGPVLNAKVEETFPEMDIAFLTVTPEEPLPFLELGQGSIESEEKVYFVGNPLMFNQIANEGRIIGKKESVNLDRSVLMIDAPIYKGNSGSPVIDEDGKVIGVIFATSQYEGEKVGLAVPVAFFMEQLKDKVLQIEK